jgi:hypothetical protein
MVESRDNLDWACLPSWILEKQIIRLYLYFQPDYPWFTAFERYFGHEYLIVVFADITPILKAGAMPIKVSVVPMAASSPRRGHRDFFVRDFQFEWEVAIRASNPVISCVRI